MFIAQPVFVTCATSFLLRTCLLTMFCSRIRYSLITCSASCTIPPTIVVNILSHIKNNVKVVVHNKLQRTEGNESCHDTMASSRLPQSYCLEDSVNSACRTSNSILPIVSHLRCAQDLTILSLVADLHFKHKREQISAPEAQSHELC